MGVDVKAEVTVYQKDDGDWGRTEEMVGVHSHWNDREMVVLVVGDHEYTVSARDLNSAIAAAATNREAE